MGNTNKSHSGGKDKRTTENTEKVKKDEKVARDPDIRGVTRKESRG